MNSKLGKITKLLTKAGDLLSKILLVIVILLVLTTVFSLASGVKLYTVQTGSMAPTYPIGTILIVEPVKFEDLNSGDTITFNISGGSVVTHRIVSVDSEKKTIQTKGDNNNVTDSAPVSYDNVIGRVKTHIPYLGYAVLILQTRFGIIMLVIFIVAILSFSFLKWLYDKEDDTEEEQQTERPTEIRHEGKEW